MYALRGFVPGEGVRVDVAPQSRRVGNVFYHICYSYSLQSASVARTAARTLAIIESKSDVQQEVGGSGARARARPSYLRYILKLLKLSPLYIAMRGGWLEVGVE